MLAAVLLNTLAIVFLFFCVSQNLFSCANAGLPRGGNQQTVTTKSSLKLVHWTKSSTYKLRKAELKTSNLHFPLHLT